MIIHKLKPTSGTGHGVFAARSIKQGELIFHIDLRSLVKMTPAEIDAHPELDGDHSDYVGRGKYVVDDSPASYMNHSCDPNCYYKMRSIAVKDVYALRDIEEGEELTHDYAATSVDQFAGKGFWVLECRCGSENCRGRVTGDFFDLPAELQRRYYPNLPPSIRRKYRANLTRVAQLSA
jgi:hypothetical protein